MIRITRAGIAVLILEITSAGFAQQEFPSEIPIDVSTPNRIKTNEMKGIPESEWGRPEHASKLKHLKEAAESSPAYKAALADYLGNSLAPFMDLPEAGREFRLDGDPAVEHGYVWLFHRR